MYIRVPFQSKMSPELLCFLTSALCALLLLGIERYHTLNIKHYTGAVMPLIEGFVDKIVPIESDMDPEEIV